MCGIVGLFLKDKALEPQLGAMLSDMLVIMTDRGPDSAGIAIYGAPSEGKAKLTVQSANPRGDFAGLEGLLDAVCRDDPVVQPVAHGSMQVASIDHGMGTDTL